MNVDFTYKRPSLSKTFQTVNKDFKHNTFFSTIFRKRKLDEIPYTFRNLLGLLESAIMLRTSMREINVNGVNSLYHRQLVIKAYLINTITRINK